MDDLKTKTDVLEEILKRAVSELNENTCMGYTMPDGKHHIFIWVDDSATYADPTKEAFYVIEPNRVIDGAHEPMGDTAGAEYNNFGELMVACMWCMEQFEADRVISNDRLSTLLHNAIICLEEQGFDKTQLESDLGIESLEYDVVMDDSKNYVPEPVKHKIYGFSEVSSEGFYDGNESRTYLYGSQRECINAAYERYCDAWSKLEEDGWIENGCDSNEEFQLVKSEFKNTLLNNGYVLIQLPASHFQFEFFEQELELPENQILNEQEVSKESRLKENDQPSYVPWHEFSLSRKECDDFVDRMVSTIRGIGIDEGSGYYGLKSFSLDDEQFNLYCEISKEQKDGDLYYTVYYGVEYDEGDTLFADWRHTEIMDIIELKDVVFDVASTDFTEDVRRYIEKEKNSHSSLSEKIEQASSRAAEMINKDQTNDLSR